MSRALCDFVCGKKETTTTYAVRKEQGKENDDDERSATGGGLLRLSPTPRTPAARRTRDSKANTKPKQRRRALDAPPAPWAPARSPAKSNKKAFESFAFSLLGFAVGALCYFVQFIYGISDLDAWHNT